MANDRDDNPFAALQGLRDALPPGPATAAPEAAGEKASGPTKMARAVVRMQRKGYGGKTVTLVDKLELPPDELEALLKKVKGHLGLGGRRDGELLVLQGDCRDRVAAYLTKLGVKKVTLG
ncbi:MAG: translation initiation factor [Deltaproteobacteria bacterium]|nr:MAG: translation initiation factor [Deltaproteobacteria bacterium]